MRRIYVSIIILFVQLTVFGQTPESEPNNTFATADLFDFNDVFSASVGNGDAIDYFRLNYLSNRNFYLLVEATNISGGVASLQFNMYDGREGAGLIYTKNIDDNTAIPDGETVYDTIYLCGQSIDNYFITFSTNEEFNYQIQWFPVYSYDPDEPNNTAGQAIPFAFNSTKEGSIRYVFRGNATYDTEDWFQSGVLPAGDYNDIKLYLSGLNTNCTGGTMNISYMVFKSPDLVTPFAQGFIGNTNNVPQYETVQSVIPLSNMQQGDIFYVRLTSNAPFGYSLQYTDMVPFIDPEDNCCYFNALPLAEDSVVGGNVGEYDYNTDEYIDEFDTYRIILPQDGAIKLFVTARNDQCTDFYNNLSADILDKNGNFLTSVTLSEWQNPIPCGQLQYDTVKIRGFAADTFYIQLGAIEKVGYNLKYVFLDATVSDSAESYNSPISTVIPIAEGQLKKGHIRFKKAATLPDASDIYQFNMPGDGSITVYMKATYRGDITSTNSSTANRLTFVTSNFTDRTPSNPPTATLTPDAVYLDTFVICGLGAGNNFFTISSSRAYEYEVYYVVNSTVTVQNDPEPNNFFLQAVPIIPNEVRSGRLRYFNDMQGASQDNFDYYKWITPYKGRLKVYVQATNTTCTTAARITLNMYKDTVTAGLVASRNLANTSTIPAGTTVYDTVYSCRFDADTAYLRLEGTQNFHYQFRFEFFADTAADIDVEPDNTFAEARFIGQGQKREGVVGLTYNSVFDGNDYNKIAITTPGLLTIYFKAQNIGCTDNRIFGVWGYRNTVNSYIFLKRYVLNAVGTVDAGQVVEDSILYNVPATTDTVFVRIEGNGAFKYEFSIKPMTPTSSFTLTGDTTACIGPVYTYKAVNVFNDNVTYNWSLPQGGGTLTYTDSIASVVWNENANRKIQLFLSNQFGSSDTKQLNVVINGVAPTQTPVAYNFARRLSTNSLPPGSICQWYRNDTLILGATDSSYYAADAGSFTVRFVNDCGPGPISNAIVFNEGAQPQIITFPHIPTIAMSPTARDTLQATASSGLTVFYQKISGPGTIVNDTLLVTGVGTIIVKASQFGDDIYGPATDVFDTITVIKGDQLITFDSIPDQILGTPNFIIPGSTTSGLTITYSIIAGNTLGTVNNLSGSAWSFTKKGAGLVTLRAVQNGNSNYNAATPVDRTFCIGVRTLTPITGETAPCIATYRYNTQKIPGANFVWTLSGGGILTTNNDTAWVQWQTPGTYTLTVKANSPCDTVYTNTQSLTITTSNNLPGVVSGMLPLNGAIDQQLPLTLSWIPGNNTVNYDLYIWDSAATEPITPYVSDISGINYDIPKNAPFPYNKTYKWRVVAKNPCAQSVGPIQTFRLIPLPDLVVSDVLAPATATSGQTITVSWKVTNAGPGRTLPNATWYDGVYFALDTVPHVSFAGSPNWNPSSWSSLTANGRPLLLGKKIRPSSLDSGQFYTNSLDFTLPLQYSFPVYIYVITDNEHPNWKILQVTVANDTSRKQDPMNITLAPTPDLRVDSVFTPSSTFSGSTINVTYKVKNYGVVTPAGGSWVDSIFMSQSPLFDRNNAIFVNSPKPNESYYPNAVPATGSHSSQVLPDSTITKSIPVVIPNYIFGTWFIYVKTNARATAPFIYEGALANNNLGQAQLQVYLTPTPKLTIETLTIPVTEASTTQSIGANWNIRNEGFKDNIEKNRGHYIFMGSCHVPCPPGTPANSICTAPSVTRDSIVFGGSYWIDRVYLSTDSTGLNTANARLVNEVKHGVQNSGLYPDPGAPTYNYVSCPAIASGNINITNVIQPGSNFPRDTSFRIPSDLQPGNYYVYVYTNPTKTVWEYPGTPQIKRSALPVSIQRPDATVPSISAPPVSAGGQQITINYSVVNNGPGAVFNHQRSDRLYISNFSNFDGSAQLIGTQTFTEGLPVGTFVPHTFTYAIPPATTGNKYFYVLTNYDSLFRETNSTNNLSASAVTNVIAALPADLVVAAVQPLDSVFTIFPTTFKYTVNNNGTGTTLGTWTDSLFISCNSTFNAATAKFVTSRVQTRSIAAGGNYTDSFSLTMNKMSYEINSCFPEQMYAPGYFFVKTNSNNGTYEGTNINNNIGGSSSRVIINPLVDHIVSSVSSSVDTVVVGIPFTASWEVKNLGYKPVPAVTYYYSYYDGIFFSFDSLVNSNDVIANGFLTYGTINRNDSLTSTRSIMTPNITTGDYYMIAKTNYSDRLEGEKILSNNHNFLRNADGSAKKVHLIRPVQPDLVDSIVTAPSSIAAGQPMTVVYRITNNGEGITYPGPWQNDLRLSEDFFANPNDGDRLLTTRTRQAALAPGESYLDTVTVTIPSWMPAGNYILIGRANSNSGITEFSTGNNLGFHLLEVYRPDSTDLIVTQVVAPDTVYLGYEMTPLKWKISNASGTDAIGYLTDGVYLSAGNLFDSTAILLGTKYRYINLSPLEIDSASITPSPLVKDVAEGNYNVFAKTDLLSNILESDKDNNVGMSVSPVYVKAKELVINVPENNTLQTVNRYYKLNIPDSLIGSTILVTLKSPDSLTMKNELFMGGGFVPTAANYDYRFEIPNYGNQQIVMTSVTEPVYYIMYRCVSPNPVLQNITLKAVKLPFAILNVHTNAGANIGNVTVRIRGSLFRDSMVAKLSNGITTIYSSAVYFTNSGQVFATFPLQGRPLGLYDVTLIKPDSSVAILPNGFSIVPANNGGLITGGGFNTGAGNGNEPGCDPGAASGLNSQLVVDLVVPSRVLIKRPVVILINYSNPTNFDIPAQSRILYSEAGIKMAFTKEGVPAGTTSLYLELVEPGGPPGIIRAGGSGTIIVHTRAPDQPPQPENFVLFKLK